MNNPTEYLCQIDSSVVPTLDTDWDMTSPDLTVWRLTVSTAGIVTITSGGAPATSNSYVLGSNGFASLFSVSDLGILTITTQGVALAAVDGVAALVDSNSVTWLFIHLLDGQLMITTENPLENKYYYPAIVISFETSDADDLFELHAVKPNTSKHRR